MIYLDSAAVVNLVHAEAESAALRSWLGERAETGWISSVLTEIESFRALARYAPQAASRLPAALDQIDLIPLDPPIQILAQTARPATVRSLDAIHLGTARHARHALTSFVTYDKRLLDAAIAAALPADSPAYPAIGHRSRRDCQGCSVAFMVVNAEQAEAWNGASGRRFIEQRERHERMRGRLTARLLAGAPIQDGENVLDIGCGCGDTTILAARATPGGHALGSDFSRIQVAEARRLAAAAGVANARFDVADAQVHPFRAGSFDVVLSNFGVMFFDDPAAAFANLRRALRHGGRLAFLCWRTRDENPFFTIGFARAAAALGLRELPEPDAAFSLADTGRVAALLSSAGFDGIEFTKVDEPMLIGRDEDDVLEYERAFPGAAGLLTESSPAQAAELTRWVRDRLAAYASPDGVIMPGAAWLVTAQAA